MFKINIYYKRINHSSYLSKYYCSLSSPSKQLDKLYELTKEANQTKSLKKKQLILKQYPECQAILKRIYDPHQRLFVTSKNVLSYMERQLEDAITNNNNNNNNNSIKYISSLEDLLDALSSRQIVGNSALDTISHFYQRYCITDLQQKIFWKIIDRNLKMGVSTKTIHMILSEKNIKLNDTDQNKSININNTNNSNNDNNNTNRNKKKSNDNNNKTQSKCSVSNQQPYDRRFMKVALAATMHSKDEVKIFTAIKQQQKLQSVKKNDSLFYVSRKLDGVRCITLIQPQHDPPILFCSRTGRTFESLKKVEIAIQQQLTKHDYWNKSSRSIVLDGEICVYPPNKNEDNLLIQNNFAYENNNQDNKKEDFLETVSQIRRANSDMDNPVYQVFDLIDMENFCQGKGGPLFSKRQKKLRELFGTNTSDYFKILEQLPLTSKDQLLEMKQKVAKYNWEGLIIRKNVPYEGRRSQNMLKLKEWEDAEYIVKDIETSWMRMPDGEEKQMMKNVIINHKRNLVSVGSGFSLNERIKYANHPDHIIGKLITVKYFSESFGNSGAISLRFPVVKAIYDKDRD
ncbi:hypothetical protein BJ944DRAFT_263162 [Cunninghamella echinulata]|nr:hypothetical protein BJ944DRAFT_263162 [Cunninghamella echinulata]